MKQASWVLVVLVVAGCASYDKARETPPSTTTANETNEPTPPIGRDRSTPADPNRIQNEPDYNRPPESRAPLVSSEPEHTFSVPDSIEVATQKPQVPEKPLVVAAFVRGEKLVRRPDALRRLAHDLDRDARIDALARLADDAPARLGLDELCAAATKQGADLLVLDIRSSDEQKEKTTLVLSPRAPWKALAYTRPSATEPTGGELVAKLVRSARTGP
ncbi:MAG TPA: hypothetical protein VFF73_14100 [Planctomycetota bacterium]|nr:hypothetical protein [Planctomycetota bacterium]